MKLNKNHVARALAVVVGVSMVGAYLLVSPATATHQPADKIFFAGSGIDVSQCTNSAGCAPVLLGEGSLKTSGPTDLIFRVTAECALVTNVKTIGNEESEAFAQGKVYVTVDGAPVLVASNDPDSGRVVFCDRTFKIRTTNFDDTDATIELFLDTRTANAFNWLKLNVGPGVHDIQVWGELDVNAGTGASAAALFGARTLIVEPVKLANDATI